MHTPVTHAMVLAAGLGTRMRPLTDTLPKPLIPVGGRTMLDRVFDHLAQTDVSTVVVNTHYLPQVMEQHLAGLTLPFTLLQSREDSLLETGGGVQQALPLLGEAAFFVANADILWVDTPQTSALRRLAAAWCDQRMDALLLLHPRQTAQGYDGRGDFLWQPSPDPLAAAPLRGRCPAEGQSDHIYAGVMLLHPRCLRDWPAADRPSGRWSLNRLFDRALAAGRLWAIEHQGWWFHVGTPQAIAPTEQQLLTLPCTPSALPSVG